jgi:hypothetical protein
MCPNSNNNNNQTFERCVEDIITNTNNNNDNNSNNRNVDVISLENWQNQFANCTFENTNSRELFDKHYKQAMFEPWHIQVLKEKIESYPIPKYYIQHNQANNINSNDLYSYLQHQRVNLQCVLSSLEDLLLAQSGLFLNSSTNQSILWPECAKGNDCIAMKYAIRGLDLPCKLTSFMFQDEYNKFIQNNIQPPIRPCVLCWRYYHTDILITLRHLQLQKSSSNNNIEFNLHEENNKDFSIKTPILQLYYNTINEENGYLIQCMTIPGNKEVILHPVCALNLDMLYAYVDENTKRIHINQDALKWRVQPIPEPRIGEIVRNF